VQRSTGDDMNKTRVKKSSPTPKRLIFKLVANVFPGSKPEFAKATRRSSLIGFRLIDAAGKPRTHIIWFRKSHRYPLNKAWLTYKIRQHELLG